MVIGARTYEELPDGSAVDPLGGLRVKGKDAPVEAFVVVSLPPKRRVVARRQQRHEAEHAADDDPDGEPDPGEIRGDSTRRVAHGGREEDHGQDRGEPGLNPAERRGRRSVHDASERG